MAARKGFRKPKMIQGFDLIVHAPKNQSPMSLYVAAKNIYRDNINCIQKGEAHHLFWFATTQVGITPRVYYKQRDRYNDMAYEDRLKYKSHQV